MGSPEQQECELADNQEDMLNWAVLSSRNVSQLDYTPPGGPPHASTVHCVKELQQGAWHAGAEEAPLHFFVILRITSYLFFQLASRLVWAKEPNLRFGIAAHRPPCPPFPLETPSAACKHASKTHSDAGPQERCAESGTAAHRPPCLPPPLGTPYVHHASIQARHMSKPPEKLAGQTAASHHVQLAACKCRHAHMSVQPSR
eukprot:1161393-Pelagomonas_calceolata.AAC.7